MEWFSRIVIAIVTVFLIGLLIYVAYFMFRPAASPDEEYSITTKDAEKGVFYAIAIDMDGLDDLSAKSIEEGRDVVLMVKANAKFLPTINAPKRADYYIFNGASSLYEYDKNFDGSIRQNDPIYNELLVVTKVDDKNFKPMPLIESGIQEIIFNHDYLTLVRKGQDAPAYMEIGFVTGLGPMNRKMKVVPLPVRMFE